MTWCRTDTTTVKLSVFNTDWLFLSYQVSVHISECHVVPLYVISNGTSLLGIQNPWVTQVCTSTQNIKLTAAYAYTHSVSNTTTVLVAGEYTGVSRELSECWGITPVFGGYATWTFLQATILHLSIAHTFKSAIVGHKQTLMFGTMEWTASCMRDYQQYNVILWYVISYCNM